ncbi:diacylglycerol acyltransferase, putative [Bodo saltans]|uniref:Diacylglycerol acyltransferase, putative n=1 Tax=Bodo saltans TaxID=75058 RepID=A0A0S4JP41_BODSA|nr:diacylglycerol acyltransferase, putative [Bodo saltans]|eukprot:CUG91922.1 diacylglycerol acyltransferase, putative [Bodo saltans]
MASTAPRRLPPLRDPSSPSYLLTDRPWYLRARLVLGIISWGVLLFAGITLHVVCDVFQEVGSHFPLVPCVFSAILFNGVAAFIAAYVGSITVESFSLYQPFVGGQSFVVLQAFGYGSIALAETLVCVYVLREPVVAVPSLSMTGFGDETAITTTSTVVSYGVLSVLGAFPLLGNIALLSSLMFFIPSPMTPTIGAAPALSSPKSPGSGGGHRKASKRVHFSHACPAEQGGTVGLMYRWSKSPQREICLVISFCTALILFSVITTIVPRAGRICLALYVALQSANGLLIHFVIGWRCTPGYRLFMPRLPSWRRTISQLVLWLLFVLSIYWALVKLGASTIPKPTTLVALCIGGVGLTTALLIFVRTAFDPTSPPRLIPGEAEHPPPHLRDESAITMSSKSMLAQYGPITMTFACLMHGCLVWALEVPFAEERAMEGLWLAQTMTLMFMLGFPPTTHLLGNLVIGESFFVWQPFRGCLPFIALQGLGWTSFGASFVALAVHITHNSGEQHPVLVAAALITFSQAMIHSSLVIFSPNDEDDDLIRRKIPKVASGMKNILRPSKRPLSLVSAVLNGEMLVAVLLMTMVMTMRVVCDVAVLQWRWSGGAQEYSVATPPLTPTTVHLMAFLSTWLGVAAVPLAHISGRDKAIPVFRPFGGSGVYVALQAIGWTVYSAALLMTTLVTVVHGAAAFQSGRWTPDAWVGVLGGFQPQSLWALPPCWFCVDAMLWLLPLGLIVVSVAVETKESWTNCSLEEDSWDAESELMALIATAMPKHADQTRAAELLHALTAPQRKQHTPWSSYGVMGSKCNQRRSHPAAGLQLLQPTQHHDEERARRRATMKEQQATATLIICMTCVGTAVLFVVGALWIGREPRVLSAAFAFAGFILTTISCFATHYVYGSLVHGTNKSQASSYAFFMPFAGGLSFVALQGVGWAFYTSATVLVLHTFLLSGASISTYLIAAVFSVSAQALILGSIPRYIPSTTRSSLERNAEALLAGLLFVASFSYTQTYRAWAGVGDSESGGGIASALTPLVVSCVSSCFAVPLTVAALHRTIKSSPQSGFSPRGADQSSEADQNVDESNTSSLALRIAQLFGLITTLLLVLLPAALAFLAHVFMHPSPQDSSIFDIHTISSVWFYFTVTIGTVTLVGALFDVLASPKSSSVAARLKSAAATFALYSVPTYVVVGPLSLPFLLEQSGGARVFTGHALVLVLLGDVTVVRFLCSIVEVCCLAYHLTLHIDAGLVYFVENGASAWMTVAADVALPLFMIWYHRRFVGAPERNGQLTSGAFSSWLDRLGCFTGFASYFRLKVVVDKPAGAHCWERGPVLFSYHPHGVFPGTTLLLQHTKAWQDAVRIPRSAQEGHHQRLSVHAAGVIFRVAFLRDFGMALGGRVVTRAAIQTSIDQGNSVMIVTGGQAEMLITRSSHSEMHMVTHHLGFLKMAIKNQIPVVPLVCFAENNVMDNIHVPWLQKRMLKLIGFPFPTVPHGRWYLPLPNRTPLTVIVGSPVNPPEGLSADDKEGVQRYADTYFAEVKRLFYAHRVESGYPNMELIFHGRL